MFSSIIPLSNCSTICETSPLIGFIVNNHSITHTYVRISKLTKVCSNIRIISIL